MEEATDSPGERSHVRHGVAGQALGAEVQLRSLQRPVRQQHAYRRPGGQTWMCPNDAARGPAESDAMRAPAAERPLEVRFQEKPAASLRVLPYALGPKVGSTCSRPHARLTWKIRRRMGFFIRPVPLAERKPKQRSGTTDARRPKRDGGYPSRQQVGRP